VLQAAIASLPAQTPCDWAQIADPMDLTLASVSGPAGCGPRRSEIFEDRLSGRPLAQ
jgi:hypothetical protein